MKQPILLLLSLSFASLACSVAVSVPYVAPFHDISESIEESDVETGEWIVTLDCEFAHEHHLMINESVLPHDDDFKLLYKYDFEGFCGYAFRHVSSNHLLFNQQLEENSALNSFYSRIIKQASHPTIAMIRSHKGVQGISPNGIVKIVTTVQNGAGWNLARISEPSLPIGTQYLYNDVAGAGVTAYVLDTGLLTTHVDFEGRASLGPDYTGEAATSEDPNGHGTHVSGIIGSTTYGVAKMISLVGVRVLDSEGYGTWSAVISGIQWALQDKQQKNIPGVINLSIAGGSSTALQSAIKAAVNGGMVVTIAAGNSDIDACTVSPANTVYSGSLTVGSMNTEDIQSSFSNWGKCVKLLAPGEDITSTYTNPPNYPVTNMYTAEMSGTSMSSPHVAGVAALILGQNPTWKPSTVEYEIMYKLVVAGMIQINSNTPNQLLQSFK